MNKINKIVSHELKLERWVFLWLRCREILSQTLSTFFLSLIYFGIVTPFGLFIRLCGHDPLKLKTSRRETYWEPHEETKSMRNQF